MRIAFTLSLIFIISISRADDAQTHRHQAPVVKFVIYGITVYTDTASLFHELHDDDNDIRWDYSYDHRAKALVLRLLKQSTNDTISFIGDSFPFADSIHRDTTHTDYYSEWYPYSILLPLLKEHRATFFDAKGVQVKHFITRKEGSKAAEHIERIYMNRSNHEQFYIERLYWISICPKF
jgi:hypothetical protein